MEIPLVIISLFQWSETDTGGSNNVGVLSTTKDVTSSGVITCFIKNIIDIRLKNEIASLNKNEHLDKLNKLIPKSYKFKNDDKTIGLIAQKLKKFILI